MARAHAQSETQIAARQLSLIIGQILGGERSQVRGFLPCEIFLNAADEFEKNESRGANQKKATEDLPAQAEIRCQSATIEIGSQGILSFHTHGAGLIELENPFGA